MAEGMPHRIDELSRFIEFLSARFKETEGMFASRLEVSERELACLRTLATEGPMITKALGGALPRPGEHDDRPRRPHGEEGPRAARVRTARPALDRARGDAGRARCALREHARGIEAIARGMLEALPERDQAALIAILRRSPRARIEAARRSAQPADFFVAMARRPNYSMRNIDDERSTR